jgi:uncharacterized protein YukE
LTAAVMLLSYPTLHEKQRGHWKEGQEKGKDMSSRVLSTDQARSAVQQLRSIINSGLTDQIQQLNSQGQVLSDPNVWDGPLAGQFRGDVWPQTKSALDRTHQSLEELRVQVERINEDIMRAGGGG